MLNVVMLSVTFLYYTEIRYAECHNTQTAAKGVFTQVILQLHIVERDLKLTI
jgi:hypothetical protein